MARRRVSAYVGARIKRSREDFRLDTFRAGGKGGQNQNKVESGVRITDLKTGISSECREERSQLQNRSKAFERLVDRLIDHYREEEARLSPDFRSGEVVRSYREIDGRVVDHRTGRDYPYADVLSGKRLGSVITDVLERGCEH